MRRHTPTKFSNGKKKDLVKITPGKRKFKDVEKNKSAKKSKVGKADYTQNQPGEKSSFATTLEKFGGGHTR